MGKAPRAPPTWKPIRKVTKMNISGGFSSKEWPVRTRTFNNRVFIDFNLADEWVCKVLTGKPPRSTAAGPSVPENTIIHQIVSQIENIDSASSATPSKDEPLDDLDSGFGQSPSSASSPALAGPAGPAAPRQRRPRASMTPKKVVKEKVETELSVSVPGSSDQEPSKVLGVLDVPGDAAKRTSKAYRAQVWLLMDDLDWVLLRLQEECARKGKRDEVVGPKDYPNIVYSLGERVWRLSWLQNNELVSLTRHVQNYKRTYPSGRRNEEVRAFLDPEEFSNKKQGAAQSLIAEAEAAGFQKPDGFEARWGLA